MKKLYIKPNTKCENIALDDLMQLPTSPGEWADSKDRKDFEVYEESEDIEDQSNWGDLW